MGVDTPILNNYKAACDSENDQAIESILNETDRFDVYDEIKKIASHIAFEGNSKGTDIETLIELLEDLR